MDWEKMALRVGAAAVGAAMLLRMLVGGPGLVGQALTSRSLTMAIVYMQTGYLIKPVVETTLPTTVAQTTIPEEETALQLALPVFGSNDVKQVKINNVSGYKYSIKSLLKAPLQWQLKTDEPTVLILHSHATEGYKGTSGYRSKDKEKNMVSVGKQLKSQLEQAGISVIHDTALHDSPSYNDAYGNARQSIQKYLKKYPSIRLVLDLHRDAVTDEDGKQKKVSITVGETSVAQLMLVVGTDAGGLEHPNWEENLALAVKLHAQLERNTPGICRPISFRSQRFNQDLSGGALIVEVGAAGNTQKEALEGAKLLGEAIIDLAQGTG